MKNGDSKKGHIVTATNIRMIAAVWRKGQNEMSELLGISRGVYAHIINLNADIHIDTAVRLSQITGITVERLRLVELTMYEIPSQPLREKKTVIRTIDRYISKIQSIVNVPLSV